MSTISPTPDFHNTQSFSDGSYPYPSCRDSLQYGNLDPCLSNACRELSSLDIRPGEKSVALVHLTLQKLFLDPNIDLCEINAPRPAAPLDHPSTILFELIDSRSAFFDTIFDGSEQLANDLWHAIRLQLERTSQPTSVTCESVLFRCVEMYVTRLLPDSEPVVQHEKRATGQLQRVRTPLDLFQPSSPILRRMKFDAPEVDRYASSSVHPRHLTMYSNFVTIMCSSEQFPCVNRIVIIRYLLKQFNHFCLIETSDADVAAIKATVHANPPFSTVLFDFLYTFLEQSPSLSSLSKLISVWLTYCRPWRYDPNFIGDLANIRLEVVRARWMPFVRNQERFYRILLGKILRKLNELELPSGDEKVYLPIAEWVWREPMKTVLQELRVDSRPPTRRLLERLSEACRVKRNEIDYYMQQKKSFWDSFSAAPEPPQVQAARNLIENIEPLLREADGNIGTCFLNPVSGTNATSIIASTSCAPQLSDTPKRGYLPDHEKDPVTGLMYLTPLGREQVITGQRKFDFSACHSFLPSWMSVTRAYECAPVVAATQWLTVKLNQLNAVKRLADNYPEDNLTGRVARLIMDPPCPNPRSPISSPVFSRTIRKAPPSLRVRVFAHYGVLFLLTLFLLFYVFGWWLLVPLVPLGLVALMFICNAMEL